MNAEYGIRSTDFIKGEVSHLNIFDSMDLGFALGKAIESGRVGIGYSQDSGSKSNALAIMSALSAAKINVWDFKEVFLSELSFLILFSALDAGVFIDSKRGSVIILGSDGKTMPSQFKRKIESNLISQKSTDNGYSNIFDMSPLNGLYLKELKNQFNCDLVTECNIKSSNERIERLLCDAVGQSSSNDFVLRINKFGTSVSAYTEKTGLIPFNKLILICELYDKNHLNEQKDSKLYKKELYKFDALFASAKLLSIIANEKTDIESLYNSIPEYYIKRKVVDLKIPNDLCKNLKNKGFSTSVDKENIIHLKGEGGSATVTPLIYGKTGVLTQCANMESAQELSFQIENLIKNQRLF